jgi:multiple sugar transport system permease protein
MKTIKRGKSDIKLAAALLFPSVFLVLLLVAYPMISNIQISFFDQPINPRLSATFVGLKNYIDILTDPAFIKSLGITLLYMILAVAGSTALGLAVAIFFNRPFKFRKIARSLIILSYVTPSISLVFAWKYMFNNGYGVVNYLGGDVLHLFDKAPLWFDNPVSSFILVVLFAIWRYLPYSLI